MSFIVAIDGPAGTGKGTIAKLVAKEFGFMNVDTGAMFRCVTLAMIRENIGISQSEKIEKLLNEIKIELKEENGEQVVFLNGEDVTNQIRTPEINSFISDISKIPQVRTKLLELQRKIAQGKNVVMEGRDIGTTVFPNADVKIYLDASSEERARRRVIQNEEKGIVMTYEEVLESVKRRDKEDSERKISPLKKADDAILVDSTNLTIDEVAQKIYSIIKEKM
ncbi:MAG: (d)CMP kinase [Clostridia bacterium]|nr:(d)CMP kinase [Clostridia bacterium]